MSKSFIFEEIDNRDNEKNILKINYLKIFGKI